MEYRPTILLPGKGYIPFDPFPYQQEALLSAVHEKFRSFVKARQIGFTTVAAAEAVFFGSRGMGEQIIIVSKDKEAAQNFLQYCKDLAYSVQAEDPDFTKIKRITNSQILFEDGSRIRSLAAGKETGRSYSATRWYFDEAALNKYADDIFQAAAPTIAQTGGSITFISSPKGRGNLFHRIAESPDDFGAKVYNYPWWVNPVYNFYYKEWLQAPEDEKDEWVAKARLRPEFQSLRKKQPSELAFKQEFECRFDADIDTVFNDKQLRSIFTRNYLEELPDPTGICEEWWQKERVEGHFYATGVDLGRKRDATVLITYDITEFPAELVEYKRIAPGTSSWEEIILQVRSTYAYFKSDVRVDSTGAGDVIFEALADIADECLISTNAYNRMKQNLIENVRHAADYGAIRMPKLPQLYREHQRYTWDDKKIVQDTVLANAIALSIFYETDSSLVGVHPEFSLMEAL